MARRRTGNADEMLLNPENLPVSARSTAGRLAAAEREHLGEQELEAVYGSLARSVVVYAHIHKAYVRRISARTVINTGGVSLSFDGDPRAAYLLLDDLGPVTRRVEYNVDREIEAARTRALPCASWIARMLATASPQPHTPD